MSEQVETKTAVEHADWFVGNILESGDDHLSPKRIEEMVESYLEEWPLTKEEREEVVKELPKVNGYEELSIGEANSLKKALSKEKQNV
jgi:hypothetical protein